MTDYVIDHFTGTDGTLLAAHAPDTGSAWSALDADFHISSNAVQMGDFATGHDVTTTTMPDDYTVSCDLTLAITGVSAYGGVVARQGAYGGPFEWYFGAWSDGGQEWQLGVFSGFGPTVLDTYSDTGFTSGTKNVALVLAGTSLSLMIDGVTRCTATDSTFTTGAAGLHYNSGVGGALAFDNFAVTSGSAPAGVHSGLTGQGFFTPGSLSAITVAIDSIPNALGTGKGSPLRYFELGNVSFGRGGFFARNYYIEHQNELVIVPFAGCDQVNYSFSPLVTATITEVP